MSCKVVMTKHAHDVSIPFEILNKKNPLKNKKFSFLWQAQTNPQKDSLTY